MLLVSLAVLSTRSGSCSPTTHPKGQPGHLSLGTPCLVKGAGPPLLGGGPLHVSEVQLHTSLTGKVRR